VEDFILLRGFVDFGVVGIGPSKEVSLLKFSEKIVKNIQNFA
jgi:hypothetical protein